MKKLWNVKDTVILIAIGALGTVGEELANHLKTIRIPIIISYLQKAPLVGTAFILRRVLTFQRVGNSQMSRHFSRQVVMLYQKYIIIIIIIIIIITIIVIIIIIIIMIIIILIYLISSLLVTTAAIQKCNQIWELHTFSQEHKNLKNLSVIILEVISFSSQEGTF